MQARQCLRPEAQATPGLCPAPSPHAAASVGASILLPRSVRFAPPQRSRARATLGVLAMAWQGELLTMRRG